MAEAETKTESAAPTVAASPAQQPSAEAPAAAAGSAPAAAAPAAEPAAAPSLLAQGDVNKREGAPKTDAKTEPAKADGAEKTAAAEPAKKDDAKPAAEPAKAEDKTKTDDKAKDAKTADKSAEKSEAKADEPGKAPGEKADALAAEPPAPPKYEAYKLPDNFKPDDARIEKFNTLLGEAELTGKADHKAIQDLGQKLVDFHAEEMQRVAKEVSKFQVDTWNRYKEGLVNDLKADPEIGGNRIETTLGNAKYAYLNYLGLNADQANNLLAALDNAGISSHPLFVRGLNNLYERLKPPESVQPNLPSKDAKGDRNRNWYDKVDGASVA